MKAHDMLIEDGLPEALLLAPETRRAEWKGRKLTKPTFIETKKDDPATKKLRKEIEAAETKKKVERLARLKELKAETKKAAVVATATPQETTMTTAAKKTAAPKAAKKKTPTTARRVVKKAAKPPAVPKLPKAPKTAVGETRPDGLRKDSKQAIMLDMVLKPDGATEQAICAKLGWKKCRVTLRRVCEKVGAKLETKKNVKEETVFFAAMPKAKVA